MGCPVMHGQHTPKGLGTALLRGTPLQGTCLPASCGPSCRTVTGRGVSAVHIPRPCGGFQQSKPSPPRCGLRPLETTTTSNVASIEEASAPSAWPASPKRVAVFVEPSPFTYVCGYKNRYCNLIHDLVQSGCEVLVVTTGKGVSAPGADTSAYKDAPVDYHGAKVVSSFSVGCPWYWQLPLSLALSPRIFNELRSFQPDVIHCSTPGLMVFSAWLYSKILRLPLVLAYHTHLPKYLPRYNIAYLTAALWSLIRVMHTAAHLTLVTSAMLRDEFISQEAAPKESIQVWRKAVDSETFHPRFKSQKMRERLTDGNPDSKVIVYVGRLGLEKNLKFLKPLLAKLPGTRLALVGDGPAREELEQHFRGTPTTFLGMLHGEELSAAYASADVFVMPSESETLGFVILESMSSQVPVVAVRAGGIPDIIHSEGVGGVLYESGDLEGATKLVKRWLDNDKLRSAAGVAARKETEKWDWRAATRDLLYVQYPRAIAAARKEYSKDSKEEQEGGLTPPQGDSGRPAFA